MSVDADAELVVLRTVLRDLVALPARVKDSHPGSRPLVVASVA
jgi:hypothetical protein